MFPITGEPENRKGGGSLAVMGPDLERVGGGAPGGGGGQGRGRGGGGWAGRGPDWEEVGVGGGKRRGRVKGKK